MGKPNIKRGKKGKYIEIISPTDSAILQITDDLQVKFIGYAKDEEPEAFEESDNPEPGGNSQGPTGDDNTIVDDGSGLPADEEELEDEGSFSVMSYLFGESDE